MKRFWLAATAAFMAVFLCPAFGQINLNPGDTLQCAACPCGSTQNQFIIQPGDQEVVTCAACEPCPPPAPGALVPFFNGDAGMVWNGSRFEATVDQNLLSWMGCGPLSWREAGCVGQGLKWDQPIMPNQSATVHGASVSGSFPAWSYNGVYVALYQDPCNWELIQIGSVSGTLAHEQKKAVNCAYEATAVADPRTTATIAVQIDPNGVPSWAVDGQAFGPESAPGPNCSQGCDLVIGPIAFYSNGAPFVVGFNSVTVQ